MAQQSWDRIKGAREGERNTVFVRTYAGHAGESEIRLQGKTCVAAVNDITK